MQKFIRNNSKKLMAVFGVLLMVVFALPNPNSGRNASSSDRLVGRLAGDTKLLQSDLNRAQRDWENLDHIVIQVRDTGGSWQPLRSYLSADDPQRGPRSYWFQLLAAQTAQHSEMYALLLKEADRAGATMSRAEIDQAFDSGSFAVTMLGENGRVLPIANVEELDSDYANQMRSALSSLLRIDSMMKQAEAAVKVSAPRQRAELAATAQQVRIACVELSGEDFLASVPPPTDAQLSRQFLDFSNLDPGHPTANNPHGFGYRFPNRVTLQYIAIPIDDIRKLVRSAHDDYTWTKNAYKEYFAHPNYFLNKAPTDASGKPIATSQPATKPFEEVRDEIVDELVAPEVQRKAGDVLGRINERLATDYAAYLAQHPANAATLEPTTQPSDTYASYEYLQQLALDIQKQTGVLPTVAQIGKYSSARELIQIQGIGAASWNGTNSTLFPIYATNYPAAIQTQDAANALQLYQPSKILHDNNGSAYLFRLTGVKPTAPPATLDDVIEQAKKDVQTAAAYDLAKQAAEKIIADANGGTSAATQASSAPSTAPTTQLSDRTLAAAAGNAGRKILQTSPFSLSAPNPNERPTPIEPLTLDPIGAATFRSEAGSLLRIASTQPATTVSKIELPMQNRVYAAQLLSLDPDWPSGQTDLYLARSANQIQQQVGQAVRLGWLQWNNVVARTQWKDERKKKDADAGA